jgi:DNA transformation protein
MSVNSEFLEFLTEQMAGFGPVSVRRMFGGAGLYRDGAMFGLVADDVLYLKADGDSRGEFEAEGLPAFSYQRSDGRNTIMSFMRAPDRCLDNAEEMADWCRRAHEAAVRSKKKPSRKGKRKGPR